MTPKTKCYYKLKPFIVLEKDSKGDNNSIFTNFLQSREHVLIPKNFQMTFECPDIALPTNYYFED